MGFEDVRLIEIEIHSHCNRMCSWCPNSFIPRLHTIEMDWAMYGKIIKELVVEDYKGAISYSRYNEPMSHPSLFREMVEMARKFLPDARLVSNTNGDFLTADNLYGLKIDELTIMDYDNIGRGKCVEKLSKAKVKIDDMNEQFIRGHFHNMQILYYQNWPESSQINDRGGALSKYSKERRTTPCMEPTYFIGIDYNGNAMPCCNMRSDYEEHKPFILGNIAEQSLKEIYESDKAKAIRKLTSTGIPDREAIELIGSSKYPCMYCTKGEGRYTRDNPGIDY